MMHPFMTVNDGTEIVHSDIDDKGSVKVYIEKPDKADCFHHATCYLPAYKWEDIEGFDSSEMDYYEDLISSTAHLIIEFASNGGFDNASSF